MNFTGTPAAGFPSGRPGHLGKLAVYDRPVAECRLIQGGEGFRGKQGLDYFNMPIK